MADSKKYHILMADIIRSRDIANGEGFMDQFKALVALANEKFKDSVISPLTITLGDEFQGIVKNSEALFKLLFFIDETILKEGYQFQLRYSLVFGDIQTEINTEIAHEMYGAGLTMARESLKHVKKEGHNHFIALNDKKDPLLTPCMRLYQSIKEDWKTADHNTISAFLEHDDYKDLKDIGIYKTRSGAWKKRKTLRIEEYLIIKDLVFKILQA